jgi:hypothetical protein
MAVKMAAMGHARLRLQQRRITAGCEVLGRRRLQFGGQAGCRLPPRQCRLQDVPVGPPSSPLGSKVKHQNALRWQKRADATALF